jgi:anti-anti-sigma factor
MKELSDVELVTRDGISIAYVRGEIDLSNADATFNSLLAGLDAGARGLVLDLTELDYVDSAGVRLLFKLASRLADEGRSMRAVVPAAGQIRRVLELANVDQLLTLDETTEAALEGIDRAAR